MYGKHVHQAVKDSGDSHTGITIHYVNENYLQAGAPPMQYPQQQQYYAPPPPVYYPAPQAAAAPVAAAAPTST